MKYAAIGPISMYLPNRVETNDQLQKEYPAWNMELIELKTGVRSRHIAEPEECSSDLGVAAAEKLFAEYAIDRSTIDFLLFCTQTPDYPLPTTACLMQERLGLPTHVGALDFNLGCSGYIYGLSLADGLIRSGAARRVLFITAETYSKYIAPDDRSLRTIFGDGAAATLIEAADEPSLTNFQFGTDGKAASALMVSCGGFRPPDHAIKPNKRQRWKSKLFMDGPALVDVTLQRIPNMVDRILGAEGMTREQVDFFIMHQATRKMLDELRARMSVDEQHMPVVMENYGNTVSSTVPIAIHDLRAANQLTQGMRSMLVGFGVGFSWAGCAWRETWKKNK